jgi:Tol biopolymer transport system component
LLWETPHIANIPAMATPTPANTLRGLKGKLVFQSNRDTGQSDVYQLYMVNLDGSTLVRLTNDRFNNWFPSVSPDGRWIAFSSNRGDTWDRFSWDLYVMTIDGRNIRRLTKGMGVFYQAAWAPDSKRLAFTAGPCGNCEIYAINLDGSGLANLTNHPANDQRPTWSPDGNQIVFGSSRDYPTGFMLDNHLYVMNDNGSRQKRLTEFPVMLSAPSGSRYDLNPVSATFPSWSPDGKYIGYALYSGANSGIYLTDVNGRNYGKIKATESGWVFAWSGDSQFIALLLSGGIYIVEVATGKWQQITNDNFDDSYLSWCFRC